MKARICNFVFWLTFAVATLIAFGAQAQNLLLNPYFTNGFSGWNGTYGLGTQSVNPAPQYGNAFCVVDDYEPAMYQSFSTVPGTEYQVTWDVRLPDLGNNGLPFTGIQVVGPAELNVGLPGLSLGYLIQNRTTWHSYSVDFVATGTSSTLSFEDPEFLANNSSYSESVLMDYASVVAVPEPSLFATLMVAFSLWWMLRNKGHTSVAQKRAVRVGSSKMRNPV